MTTADLLRRVADLLDAQPDDTPPREALTVDLSVHARTPRLFALVTGDQPITVDSLGRWVTITPEVHVHPPAGLLTETPPSQPRVRTADEVRALCEADR